PPIARVGVGDLAHRLDEEPGRLEGPAERFDRAVGAGERARLAVSLDVVDIDARREVRTGDDELTARVLAHELPSRVHGVHDGEAQAAARSKDASRFCDSAVEVVDV